jgi:hypothetical protein
MESEKGTVCARLCVAGYDLLDEKNIMPAMSYNLLQGHDLHGAYSVHLFV